MPSKASFIPLYNQVAGRQYYFTVQDGETKSKRPSDMELMIPVMIVTCCSHVNFYFENPLHNFLRMVLPP